MNNRQLILQLIKVAGYHNDVKAGVSLFIENRIGKASYMAAFDAGRKARKNGEACTCPDCTK